MLGKESDVGKQDSIKVHRVLVSLRGRLRGLLAIVSICRQAYIRAQLTGSLLLRALLPRRPRLASRGRGLLAVWRAGGMAAA